MKTLLENWRRFVKENEDDDDFDWEIKPHKESDFTPAQVSVLKNVADEQFDKIDMDSPEISKAVYSLNKDGLINFDTGELSDYGRIVVSDLFGEKYDFEKWLAGGKYNEGKDFQKDSSYVKDHPENKEELIGDGGQENSPPYNKKPIKKRSKSAPPAG